MATILKATDAVPYNSGEDTGGSPLVGGTSRVIRYTFTTPATGASSFSVSITGVSMYQGSFPEFRFFLTTSPTSHVNANYKTTEYDGTLTRTSLGNSKYQYSSDEVSKLLLPNTTYYLYIFGANSNELYAYFPKDNSQYTTDLATIIIEGGAGLVFIDSGSSMEAYQVYIDNGSGWDMYIPYIDNGSGWDMYS